MCMHFYWDGLMWVNIFAEKLNVAFLWKLLPDLHFVCFFCLVADAVSSSTIRTRFQWSCCSNFFTIPHSATTDSSQTVHQSNSTKFIPCKLCRQTQRPTAICPNSSATQTLLSGPSSIGSLSTSWRIYEPWPTQHTSCTKCVCLTRQVLTSFRRHMQGKVKLSLCLIT